MNTKTFDRVELLLGSDFLSRAQSVRVIIFGVGGVGSWCAESLVRSGISHITFVDDDVVSATNINRQLMATTSTVGKAKVEVLRERLLDVNPTADIITLCQRYTPATSEDFHLQQILLVYGSGTPY